MSPLYDFECQNKKCGNIFEGFNTSDDLDAKQKCDKCGKHGRKIISMRASSVKFTDRLYPFFHAGIGEVVSSEKQLSSRCKQLGFVSHHEGAHMTQKQEQLLMSKRVHDRPREVIEKATWSGAGRFAPTLHFGGEE